VIITATTAIVTIKFRLFPTTAKLAVVWLVTFCWMLFPVIVSPMSLVTFALILVMIPNIKMVTTTPMSADTPPKFAPFLFFMVVLPPSCIF